MSTTTATETRPVRVALIGNPNTGKSTLFNALAGMNARVGNYPGVTVEKKVGTVRWGDRTVDLIDLPGTYSLSPRSADEMVSVDVLLGRQPDVGALDVVVCIADATNLERHLYLVSQILDIGQPVVLVLNMWDAVQREGWEIDVEQLSAKLGVPVVVTEAHRRRGIDELREAIVDVVNGVVPKRLRVLPDAFYAECDRLSATLPEDVPSYLRERLLLDAGGTIETQIAERQGPELRTTLAEARERLKSAGCDVPFAETHGRFAWARDVLKGVATPPQTPRRSWTDRLDNVLTHRVLGLPIFLMMMFVVFQTIYTWAGPLMEACEAGQNWIGSQVTSALAPGPFRSLLVDGVVAGVGSVIVFLPQIVLLFFFIALLEDSGYLARAAYMMDRLMAAFGLSGKSFLPLMSSFACAIPGVMATRTIDNRRERMITILIAPLMSCSARLPVYLLLIGAFIPEESYLNGWVDLRALTLLAMSSLGLVIAIPVAWILKKTFFKGESSPFVMEMPDYKCPSPRLVIHRVYDRGKAFVMRAGTLIFATTVLVWAASYFPGDRSEEIALTAHIEQYESNRDDLEAEDAELGEFGVPKDSRQRAEIAQRIKEVNGRIDLLEERRNAEYGKIDSRQPARSGRPVCGTRCCPAGLGLADRRGGDRVIPGARSHHRHTGDHLQPRGRRRRGLPRPEAEPEEVPSCRRDSGVQCPCRVVDDGLLCIVRAMCVDPGRDSARDEQLALAGVQFCLHDGFGLRRSIDHLPGRGRDGRTLNMTALADNWQILATAACVVTAGVVVIRRSLHVFRHTNKGGCSGNASCNGCGEEEPVVQLEMADESSSRR